MNNRMKSLHILIHTRLISAERGIHRNNRRFFQKSSSYLHDKEESPDVDPSTNLIYNKDTGIISNSTSNENLFRTIIGLEIHAQLRIPTKLFSSAPTKHFSTFFSPNYYTPTTASVQDTSDAEPNTNVSLFDIGYPGTLPILSQAAVQAAVQTAHALQCTIAPWSLFERKHYHYADLPLGYQITQQQWPIARNGQLQCRKWKQKKPLTQVSSKNIHLQDTPKIRRRGQARQQQPPLEINSIPPFDASDIIEKNDYNQSSMFTAYIDRIQIEQDTGKTITISQVEPSTKIIEQYSLIDFNRAGCALVEIVFTPCITSAYEAASVVSTLQSLLRFIGVCDGKMESGSLRCDLNISISPIDSYLSSIEMNSFTAVPLHTTGHRVEVKNLNSIRHIIAAIEYEAIRQSKQRIQHNPTRRETRTWDTKVHQTIKLRDKGDAVDYRFMPEPDVPPIILNEKMLNGMTLESFLLSIPELPMQVAKRLQEQDGLSEDMANLISSDRSTLSFYENTIQKIQKSLIHESQSIEDTKQIANMTANWLCNDLFALIKSYNFNHSQSKSIEDIEGDRDEASHEYTVSVDYSRVDVARFSSMLVLLLKGSISSTQAKKILSIMFHEDLTSDAATIAQSKGWKLIKDLQELERMCRQVIFDTRNKDQLDQYRKGGKHIRKLSKFYFGEVMSFSGGNAHPEWLEVALEKVLTEANDQKGI